MDIQSIVRVTFDPGGANQLVLCTWTDKLASDLVMPAQNNVQVSPRTRSLRGRTFARGNVMQAFQLAVVSEAYATEQLAEAAKLAKTVAIPWAITATLRIEVTGGPTYNIPGCSFQSFQPTSVRDGRGIPKVIFTYGLVGGLMS